MSPISHRASRPLRLSIAVALVAALAGTLGGPMPAAATVLLNEKGTVGDYAVTDTNSAASVTCGYTTVREADGLWKGKLTRIDVRPPQIWAVAGEQQVGWRFIIRRYRYIDKPGLVHRVGDPHVVTYRSPIMTSVASPETAAELTGMGVDVQVPPGTRKRNWAYNVVVKMFWYRPNGTKQGSAALLLSNYEVFGRGDVLMMSRPWCYARTGIWLE